MFRHLCIVMVVWGSGMVPSVAWAQTAAEHMEAGLEARREHRDAEAAEHFRAAYEADRSPRALAQLALPEQALGRWIAAEASLVQALTREDEWIERHREVLDQALATIRTHIGELLVESNVRGARVSVDGHAAGTLPLTAPVRAEAGTVVVELQADGYVTVQRRAEITAGSLARVSIELVAVSTDPDPQPAPDPDPEPAAEPTAEALADPEPPSTPDTATEPSPLFFAGIAGAAATVASLVATLVALAVREDAVLVWNDGARCPMEPGLGRLARCQSEYSTWRSAEDWAIAGAVTTGILAALTVTLFGVGAADSSEPAVAFDVGPERFGATARVSF